MSLPDLPLPPPFMWACEQCTEFLDALVAVFRHDAEDVFYDGPLRCQIMFAVHLAADHPDEIPAPHMDGCSLCMSYGKRGDTFKKVWAEHRARDLFLPAGIARAI